MILGIGVDLLRNSRMASELARDPWRASDGVFREEEILQCQSAPRPVRSYAAFYAAKEATLKALGTPIHDLAMFRDVEVVREGGAYRVVLHDRTKSESEHLGVRRISLSIGATGPQTSAVVIVEG